MLSKLALRNAKRSFKDYLVYMITMTIIAALMFAFNTMIFSKDIMGMCQEATVMIAMLGLATFFIVCIVAWLINYMVKFMLEKRSKEFGTYLLLGMKKKQIARLYMRENIMLGVISFVLGLGLGLLLQQLLMMVFYQVFQMNYTLSIQFSLACFLMTFGCYFGCYILALLRNKRKFRKMNIHDLMNMEKQNEMIRERGERAKQWLFFLSVGYLIGFNYYVLKGPYTVGLTLCLSAIAIIAIYSIYVGFSAFLIRYIRNGGNKIYEKTNLFLYRQLSSKMKTMRFTMGTLTVLFSLALIGGTVAMMFSDYQNKQLERGFPFDIIIYSDIKDELFTEEINYLKEKTQVTYSYTYQLYEDGTNKMNEYLYTHLKTFGNQYKNENQTLNETAVLENGYAYYDFDTYMKLSDYNILRKMLGYEEVTLSADEYIIQTKERVLPDLNEKIRARIIDTIGGSLHLKEIRTEEFSQNGNNGADYLIIIPDASVKGMRSYGSGFVADILGDAPDTLGAELTKIRQEKTRKNRRYESTLVKTMDENSKNVPAKKEQTSTKTSEEESQQGAGIEVLETMGGVGSDQMVVYTSDVLVRTNVINELRFILTAATFPLVYTGLVFLCVALTIMSVQQLSDSNKYKFRYSVLSKLGMKEREINAVVLKQLSTYYICPVVIAVLLSIVVSIFISERFIFYTGIKTSIFLYYGVSLVVFLGVYLLYFAATYVAFKRNVKG